MKTIRHLLLAAGILFACSLANAANHAVGPGQSIQTAVNGASSGDTIVLTAPAEYVEDVAIAGKALRLVTPHRGVTRITGSLAISATPANGKVTLRNLTLQGNLDANGSSLELLRCEIHGTVTLPSKQGPAANDLQLTVLQSNLREKLISRTAKSWVGYSTMEQTYFEGKVEIVGNLFDGRGFGGIGIDLNGTDTDASIHNNQIYNFQFNANYPITETCIGIRIDGGAKADVRNNRISENRDNEHSSSETFCGMGVYVKSTAKTRIIANLMWHNYVWGGSSTGNAHVWASAENVVVRHNAMNPQYSPLVLGGAVNADWLNVDAYHSYQMPFNTFLVDPAGLANGRSSKDKGPVDPIYRDHDGTRNDIGPNGGRNYIPNGRTTDKPIPIMFSASPIFVPAGGVITIESTGATVK